ncbi:hypothetical protein TNCV_3947821 [Trichonephila clavipes]|nr:hypothetical protein TNCV_3947821 [Trichonephila clavipes]
MTEYQRVNLNEASGSKNMTIEDIESPSALNSTNGFSKADGDREMELTGNKRNFWQRRSKMEKYLLAILIVLLLLVLTLFIVSVIREHNTVRIIGCLFASDELVARIQQQTPESYR